MHTTSLDRLKALVLYICGRCDDPTTLGKKKLNKILFFADFLSYRQFGKAITQETYVKHQFGPVPKHIDIVLNDLVSEQALAMRDSLHFGKPKKEFFAMKRADLSIFSAEEISMVDDLISSICYEHTAVSISEESHNLAWEAAKIGEEIPYFAVFAFDQGEITGDDLEWARNEIRTRSPKAA